MNNTLATLNAWGRFTKVHSFQLRARLGAFLLLSLCVHLAGLWFLGRVGPIDYSDAAIMSSPARMPKVLTVSFDARENPDLELASQLPGTKALVADQETTAATNEVIESAEQVPKVLDRDIYFATGQLTRLPFPLTDIDLNETAIDEVALSTVIELTILVDVYGTVADVVTTIGHDSARIFADRVAAHFYSARFSPGEIDGKAVRSKLQVTVVSEPLSRPASKS